MHTNKRIAANQRKNRRWERAEKTLRQIRQRIFDYKDDGPEKYRKACRVMATCKRLLRPKYRALRKAAEDRKLQRTPSHFE